LTVRPLDLDDAFIEVCPGLGWILFLGSFVAIFDLIRDLANAGEVWMELRIHLRRETFCLIVHRMRRVPETDQ
jgi:hypothetical protein